MGQADFGKLELNNRNHSGNCQRLSVKRVRFATQRFEQNAGILIPSRFRYGCTWCFINNFKDYYGNYRNSLQVNQMLQSSQASTVQASYDPLQFQGFYVKSLQATSQMQSSNSQASTSSSSSSPGIVSEKLGLKLSSRTLVNDLTTNG